jgi:hypothetical protein
MTRPRSAADRAQLPAVGAALLRLRSAVHVLEYHGHFELPGQVGAKAAATAAGGAERLYEEVKQGSATLSLCTAAHPLHTGVANVLGVSISEATMRPNPR